MQHSITTRRITGLALAALALTSPLATQPAQAGFFDKIVGKIKDKAKEKFQEYTNPQFLAGKLAERLGKKVPNAPAPGFAMPPVVAAPAPAPAPPPPPPRWCGRTPSATAGAAWPSPAAPTAALARTA